MSAQEKDDQGRTNLFHAITVEESTQVKDLIEAGVDANLKDVNGKTALMLAAERGSIKCLRVLLHRIRDDCINQKNDFGDTVLHAAVSQGHIECVGMLIEFGVNLNERNMTGETAICVAATKGHSQCVTALLNASASFDLKDINDKGSLCVAARNGHLDCIIKLMFSAGFKIEQDKDNERNIDRIYNDYHKHLVDSDEEVGNVFKGCAALCLACTLAQHDCFTALIDIGLAVNLKNPCFSTPLWYSAIRGDLKCLTMLIKAGADVNIFSWDCLSPIGNAVYYGHIECVRALINAGADVNDRGCYGNSILYNTVCNRNIQCMNILIEAGANVDDPSLTGETALFHVIKMGYDDVFETLMRAGAKVNMVDKRGDTPLSEAIRLKQDAYVEKLIWAGATIYACFRNINNHLTLLDTNQVEKYRYIYEEHVMKSGERTPALLIAAWKGQHEEVASLLENGVDVNVKGEDDSTALIVASWEGHLKCVNIILNVDKVDISATDYNERTALYAAACGGHLECLKRILTHTAHRKDFNVLEAFIVSIENDFPKCVEMLFDDLPDSMKSSGEIARVIDGWDVTPVTFSSYIKTLLKADVFYWMWYYSCSTDIRCLTKELLVKGCPPDIHRSCSPLKYAFWIGDCGLVRYLLANLYLTPIDLDFFQTDAMNTTLYDRIIPRHESAELQRLYHQLISGPWRLEILSILKIFSILRKYDRRQEEAVSLSELGRFLPAVLLKILKFLHPIRYLCIRQWKSIEGDLLNLRNPVWPYEGNMVEKADCRSCLGKCMIIKEENVQ